MMSALGQKQRCAAHKPVSAKCQKRTFVPEIVARKPMFALVLAEQFASDGRLKLYAWRALRSVQLISARFRYLDFRDVVPQRLSLAAQ